MANKAESGDGRVGDFMPLCAGGRTPFIVMPLGSSRWRGKAVYSHPPLISRKP